MNPIGTSTAADNRILAAVRMALAIGILSLMTGFSSTATAQTSTKPQAAPSKPAAAKPAAKAQPMNVPSFDHNRTGFILRDVHTTLRCEQCHVDGIFKNTPKECSGCHAIGTRVNATPKPVNHVQTNLPCDTCHISATSFLVKSFKHVGVVNNCSTCHNGQSLGVISKPANHFPTLLPCENCHTNTTTFTSWRMDHTGITSGCAMCHSGQFPGVVSMPVMHIPTGGAGCETCHSSTTTFLGALYNHSAAMPPVAGRCTDCHSGTYPGVVAKPAVHIITTAQCDTCHTQATTQNYTTFLGALVNHAAFTPPVTGRCSDCHNGVNATGKPAWHMPTTGQCDTCHGNANNYTSWLGAIFTHTTVTNTCPTCHNGVNAKGMSAGHIPTGAIPCDQCHAIYNGTTVTSFFPGTMNHVATVAIQCQICHNGAYTTQGTLGAQAKVSNHIPTTITGALDCIACHPTTISTTITTMSWAQPPEKMNHNGAQGMGNPIYCVTCHLSGTTYLGSMQKKSHNGASVAKDCSSSSCHRPLGRIGTAYSAWN